jgi:hypothetical protein
MIHNESNQENYDTLDHSQKIIKENNELFFLAEKKSVQQNVDYYGELLVRVVLWVPSVSFYLLWQSIYNTSISLKNTLLWRWKPDQWTITALRNKINGFNHWKNQVKSFYEDRFNDLLVLGIEWYKSLQSEQPEIFAQYMRYYWINSKEEYTDFLTMNIEKWISQVEEKWILAWRANSKRIPELWRAFVFMANMFFTWYCNIWTDNPYFLVRPRKKTVSARSVESTTVHEAEHFMQNALSGSYGTKKDDWDTLSRYVSPVHYAIMKKMTKCFKNIGVPINSKSEEISQDTVSVAEHIKKWGKTILFIYKKTIDPWMEKYFTDFWEIMARVREIKHFLWMRKWHYTMHDLRKLDWIHFQPWHNIKWNITNETAFLHFLNEVP